MTSYPKGLIEMKSRIMSSIAIVTFFSFIVLLLVAIIVFPMHIGEPSYYVFYFSRYCVDTFLIYF